LPPPQACSSSKELGKDNSDRVPLTGAGRYVGLVLGFIVFVSVSTSAQAWPVVAECNLCLEVGYQATALDNAPQPHGGQVHIVDWGNGELRNYLVMLPAEPGDPTMITPVAPDPAVQDDFDDIVAFLDWIHSGGLQPSSSPQAGLRHGIESAYDVVLNGSKQNQLGDWIANEYSLTAYWQSFSSAVTGVLGNHAPDVEIVFVVEFDDGSQLNFESSLLITQNGAQLQFNADLSSGIDADGNFIHVTAGSYTSQQGSVSGDNVDRFANHLIMLGWGLAGGGDEGDNELDCNWRCPPPESGSDPLGDCKLTCTIPP